MVPTANTNVSLPGDAVDSRALTVRRVPCDELAIDPDNARSHSEQNVKAICDSLLRFGQQKPIVVAPDGTVVAGNGTLEAARSLGWTHIACITTDLGGADARGFAIADNRTAELAEWDVVQLASELHELPADLMKSIGFDEAAMRRVAREAEAAVQKALGQMADDEVPTPPPDPVAKRGDIWVLGSHRLLCGDSTSAEDVARLMDGESAALFATDPPYCVDYTGADRPAHDGQATGKDWSHVYNEVDIADLGVFLNGVFVAALPHTRDHAAIYLWHAHRQFPTIAQVFERHGLLLHQPLVWVKPTATFTHAYYAWRHEPCAFGWKKGHKPPHSVERQETTWFVDWEGKQRIVGNEHPTQKPVELFARPMRAHTMPGDVCLEPFSGSGSQIIAAERLGRRCFALELQPAFVDVAVRRWEMLTGKKAERIPAEASP